MAAAAGQRIRRLTAAAMLAAALAAPAWAAGPANAAPPLATAEPADAAARTAAAETLMRESGLWAQLASMVPQVRAGLAQGMAGSRPMLKPEDAERLAAHAGVAFAPARMQAVARAALARTLLPQHTPALLAWYATPLGKRLAQLEEAAAQDLRGPEAQMQAGAAALEAASEARQALIARLARVTRAAESMAAMMINMTVAVQAGLASSQPHLPGLSSRELRADLEAQRAHMEQGFAQFALAAFAGIYADVADADLATYADFLASEAGSHFTDAGLRAMEAAVIDGAEELGRGLGGGRGGATT